MPGPYACYLILFLEDFKSHVKVVMIDQFQVFLGVHYYLAFDCYQFIGNCKPNDYN